MCKESLRWNEQYWVTVIGVRRGEGPEGNAKVFGLGS